MRQEVQEYLKTHWGFIKSSNDGRFYIRLGLQDFPPRPFISTLTFLNWGEQVLVPIKDGRLSLTDICARVDEAVKMFSEKYWPTLLERQRKHLMVPVDYLEDIESERWRTN